MVPADFANFFAASAGAGAALVGLLFVAVSIAPEQTIMAGAPPERQARAASAFTALLNAFFVSLGGLIPHLLGQFAVVFSLFSLSSSLSLGWAGLRRWRPWRQGVRHILLVAASLVLYGFELQNGVALLRAPGDVGAVYALTTLLIWAYALGLWRAWELLGARRYGLLSWLGIFREPPEATSPPDGSTPPPATGHPPAPMLPEPSPGVQAAGVPRADTRG